MTAAGCPGSRRVDQHFAGRLAASEEKELRAHLVDCQACRRRYGRQLQLSALDPRSLSFEERLARGLGLRRRWRAPWVAAAALAGSAALGLFLLVGRPGSDEAGAFRARGAAHPPALVLALDDGKTEVLGFRVGNGGHQVATRSFAQTEELAFAYRNGGGWPWLMIFARAESGATYWFQPAWTEPASDPRAVAISPSAELRELPQAVSHTFPPGKLTLCALVARQPLSARQVEAQMSGGGPAESLAQPGRQLACVPVEVAP